MITPNEFQSAKASMQGLRQTLKKMLNILVWDNTEYWPAFREHLIQIEDELDALNDEFNEFSKKIKE